MSSAESASFTTLVEVLQLRAREAPDKVACIFLPDHGGEARLTYGELDRRARAVATVLADSGATGERAFLLYPPGLDYIVAFFGCLYAGVVAIPAYPPDPTRLDRTLPRLQAIMQDARPRLSLTTAAIRALATGMFQRAPDLAKLHWLATDTVDPAAAERYQEPVWDSELLAFLQYTSGSTGNPKGVMLSHANLLANLLMIKRNFGLWREDRIVSWLPPYHDMGLIGTILGPLYNGATAILLSPFGFLRKPRRWLEAITQYRGTVAGGPNFGYDLCVRKVPPDQRAGLDLSTLEVLFVGAEPIRARTMGAFADAFAPCGFRATSYLPCFGLAEATLLVSGAAGEDSGIRGGGYRSLTLDKAAYEQGRVQIVDDRAGAALTLVGSGHVSPLVDLRIVDPESGRSCKEGEVGEVWLAGACVAGGYWEREEETLATFGARLAGDAGNAAQGYLRTGDLGFLHGDELFICGRRKDLIIVRGRNLHPQDIEGVVDGCHAQIRPGCCAAFSVEQNEEERLVVAVEVSTTEQPALRADEILRTIQESVAAEHGLRVDEILLLPPSTIPKTSSGKIQRRACRASFLDGTLPRIQVATAPAAG
jgi:acyl-CoA synthetase (AMP-forming)/AMP-acid ligase II